MYAHAFHIKGTLYANYANGILIKFLGFVEVKDGFIELAHFFQNT